MVGYRIKEVDGTSSERDVQVIVEDGCVKRTKGLV